MTKTVMCSDVCIVIPAYSPDLSTDEVISLTQCAKILCCYDIYIVAPSFLDTANYVSIFNKNGLSVRFVNFDPVFFTGIEGYNRLMMSQQFYSRFKQYQYMLIHQLDAFVFRDELLNWCNRGYDYIGAPWLNLPWHPPLVDKMKLTWARNQTLLIRFMTRVVARLKPGHNYRKYTVGNGGLSLRNVKRFEAMTVKFQVESTTWPYNEDVFWSLFIPIWERQFSIPRPSIALRFAFDQNPGLAYELSNKQLPFGVHAWNRHDNPYGQNKQFWTPIIREFLDPAQLEFLY